MPGRSEGGEARDVQRSVSGDALSPPGVLLLVEDERLLRWSLARQLETAGYDVREAADLESGLLLADGDVRLVLLDLRLPDGHAVDRIAEFRARTRGARIVVMSSWISPEVAERATRAGASGAIAKPFAMNDLLELVGRLIRS